MFKILDSTLFMYSLVYLVILISLSLAYINKPLIFLKLMHSLGYINIVHISPLIFYVTSKIYSYHFVWILIYKYYQLQQHRIVFHN